MNILFFSQGDDGSMFDEFRRCLPEANLIQWRDQWHKNDHIVQASINAAIVWMPPPDFFDGLSQLTHVYAVSAGVDHLLEHPGLPAESILVRLKDAGMAQQMEEYVLLGVLLAQRGFTEYSANQRAHLWKRGSCARSASDTPVGILGAGALGCAVAQRLQRNDYPVSCWSRSPKTLPEGISSYCGEEGLAAITQHSRVLVCLLPLTGNTRGILNKRLFSQLPKGAYLINCARGAHLVEEDLLAALDQQQLQGALLDVFLEEPLPASHPFWDHSSIVITPHEAAKSLVAETVEQTVSSIRTIANGGRPDGQVDRQSGY